MFRGELMMDSPVNLSVSEAIDSTPDRPLIFSTSAAPAAVALGAEVLITGGTRLSSLNPSDAGIQI
jgi:hypothetical protein